MIKSASCSIAPDSEIGQPTLVVASALFGRRDSARQRDDGTFSSFASALSPREIWLTSCWRSSSGPA
jgi:hypothetical protein